MADLEDGESTEVQGSGSNRYTLKNTGGVYSCSCPAWRNQGGGIEKRSCKHLRAFRGDAAEQERTGGAAPAVRKKAAAKEGASGEPPLLLAHPWDGQEDPTGFWMSEKLDGVRAYWDGKGFVSRLGNAFHAPDWFLDGLPSTPLDGELWGGRKQFQRTVGLVKRQDKSEHWRELVYVVFDAPALASPFEERLAAVRRDLGARLPKYARAHEHEACKGIPHLKSELARVEGLGGEGLMLRRPGSLYQVGRSSTLLKVKTFQDDEAKVIEHLAGAGRHKGRLGALLVTTPGGVRFSVGTGFSDAERKDPPPVGTIITYRFQELSEGGVPRFPSYVGVRADAQWPEEKTKKAPAAKKEMPKEKPKPAAKSKPAAAKTGGARRFEFVEGGSSKFWEISVDGASHTVRFGRIGTEGQTKTKDFADEAAAASAAGKLVEEKLAKGYTESPI